MGRDVRSTQPTRYSLGLRAFLCGRERRNRLKGEMWTSESYGDSGTAENLVHTTFSFTSQLITTTIG